MGTFPVVLLLCSLHALTAVVQAQETDDAVVSTNEPPNNCREEPYPCTRMYSHVLPMKKCIGGLCLYSLSRVYVVNNEFCTRTVCQDEEYRKAELCRERSGWPRRLQRSTHKKRCRDLRSNPKTWANKA